ncbi:hypothetical protein AQUCO_00300534v1 [Aquilegia coerulea]|uniref:Jacalin-type lectin domain-containing protein n=1 Tax=Aquilegia coerulea TaxID=218851 RepID=A0A2G5EZA4_AQUCA|nr:hypothetical protein AQUCO_00300534v1 [Aquilegia coerulea]
MSHRHRSESRSSVKIEAPLVTGSRRPTSCSCRPTSSTRRRGLPRSVCPEQLLMQQVPENILNTNKIHTQTFLKFSSDFSYMDMIKVNAQGSCVSKTWDQCGKNRICRIFVTNDNNGINSIQFGYVKDGDGNSIVLSNRFGGEFYDNFFTVTLNYPDEYITIVRGSYGEMDGDKFSIIGSLTFDTNLRTYGPFGQNADEEGFTIEMGADFFGFHGYRNKNYLRAICVYIKPMASVMHCSSV